MKPKLGCGRSSEILTEDIVRWWKEYFEDLLKPTHMSSIEEAQSGDEEDDSSITVSVTSPPEPCYNFLVAGLLGWMR